MAVQDKNRQKKRQKRTGVPVAVEHQAAAKEHINKRKAENPEMFTLPASKRSIDNLADYFSKVEDGINRILPKEKRHYVMYLRKSTDDEAKQVRSLEDQLTECLELAKRLQLTQSQLTILVESASAKISGNRPIFDDMITGFKTGKYHGLIAWSPDRLSRNMKEAGEIIEMIDLEQIQDLQFKTYQFENTPNGKMLLGILFATSKQYSDKLAVDVSRGITGNIKDGKYSGTVKRGYFVDNGTGYFVPDGYQWELLREAVNLRLYQGKTNIEVANFLNANHFGVRKDQDEDYKHFKITKQMVGNMFEDTFYFGLYQFGKNMANLTELYDFLPLITPDEYILLNQKMSADFGEKFAGRSVQNKRLDYGLLRSKVICDFCDTPMQFQHQEIKRGKNKGRWLISYYCRNRDCIRHDDAAAKAKYGHALKKSIRAKYVTAAIEYTLRQCTQRSKEAYKQYIDKLELKLAQDRAIAKRKLNEAKADLHIQNDQYLKYQHFQVDHPNEYAKHHKGKLEHHQNLINVANVSIMQSETTLQELNVALPSEEQFYELINSYLSNALNAKDLLEEDAVYSEVVSNLRAGDDFVSVVNLNKPYNLLLDLSKISTGREQPSVLELYNFIIDTTDHYSNLCVELEAIRRYEPNDEALVML